MDLSVSPRARTYIDRAHGFLHEHVLPAEAVYAQQRRDLITANKPHDLPPVIEELKILARDRGLWNLFLPDCTDPEHGLTVLDYAHVAEVTGRSIEIAPEAMNCSAPDTGNMELLHMFATPEQREQWLQPLLEGRIRSGFAMTEPDVASSDATNIATTIESDKESYVINGLKWWTTGVLDPRCTFLIVMGKTNPDADVHHQQSMVIVPTKTSGVLVHRSLPVFGYHDQHGHGEVEFTNVRVPKSNLLGAEGSGFALAQARLGPGRIHHCMRMIGLAERALELMVARASERITFGKPLAQQGVVQEAIALSRLEIDQARLLVLNAAATIDAHGSKAARAAIAAIKVVAPRTACAVADRAIQIFGGAGVSDDTPLAAMYAIARSMRIVDGPDDVHIRDLARIELGKERVAPPPRNGFARDGGIVQGPAGATEIIPDG